LRKLFAILTLLLVAGSLVSATTDAQPPGQIYFCSASGFQGSGYNFQNRNTCLAQCGNNDADCQPPKPIDWAPAGWCCLSMFLMVLVFAAVAVKEGVLDRFFKKSDPNFPRLKGTVVYRDTEYNFFHKGGSYPVGPDDYEWHGHLVSNDKKWRTPINTGAVRIAFVSLFKGVKYFYVKDLPEADAKNAKTIEDLRRENAALKKQSRDAALEMLDGVKSYSFRLGKIREDLGATIIQATKGSKGYDLGNASDQKAED
jgi:hypothetical protein